MSSIQPAISPFDWTTTSLAGQKDSPGKLRETAQQFESLLIGMMLKSMREASGGGGWFGTGDDQSLSTIAELGEQQVAQALSSSGGLGLARMISDGLAKSQHSQDATPESSSKP
jgi:peptidoglycan hydrolase FlgJ